VTAAHPPDIVVVGSLNMDLVMHLPRMPAAGETMAGRAFHTTLGGKGANQAVACARMGARVAMVGRVGADDFGRALLQGLADDKLDADCVGVDGGPSGVAMILIEPGGQNRIVIAAGANATVSATDIDAAGSRIAAAKLLVVQMEIPLPAVIESVTSAAAAGLTVLLNPAPALGLPAAIWPMVDILVPNETEATQLTGVPVTDVQSAVQAAQIIRGWGVRHVVITLGARGIAIMDAAGARTQCDHHSLAAHADAIDTTGAGDCFIGGLASGLTEGMSLDEAARLGQAAAAICVTRQGAQAAMPWRRELGAR
jgi:ribokinase